MRYFNSMWLRIKHIFILRIPMLSHLDYVDYVAEEKSYFVFTWRMKNAYRLKIKSAKFKSHLKSGSAYTALLGNDNHLEIIISNSWRSQKYLIKLRRIIIDNPIEFPVVIRNSFKVQLKLPAPKPNFSRLKVYSFKAQIVDKKQIKTIINISYPN